MTPRTPNNGDVINNSYREVSNDDGDQRGRQKRNRFRACLLGGGGPQIGEVNLVPRAFPSKNGWGIF